MGKIQRDDNIGFLLAYILLFQLGPKFVFPYYALWRFKGYDCHPIYFIINLSNSPPGSSSWKANARYLQESKDPIKAFWEASPSQMPFFTKLREVVKFYKQFCIAKAVIARMEGARTRK